MTKILPNLSFDLPFTFPIVPSNQEGIAEIPTWSPILRPQSRRGPWGQAQDVRPEGHGEPVEPYRRIWQHIPREEENNWYNSDIIPLALGGLSLVKGPVSTVALAIMMGGLLATEGYQIYSTWDQTSDTQKVMALGQLGLMAAGGFVGGMAGQGVRTGVKGLLATVAAQSRDVVFQKVITNVVTRAVLPRFFEAYAFNTVYAVTQRGLGDERAFKSLNLLTKEGWFHTAKTAIWMGSSHQAFLWRQKVNQPNTSLQWGRAWVEGTLIGSTLEYELAGVGHYLGLEEHVSPNLWLHLSRALPEMALMHLGNKAMGRLPLPQKFGKNIGGLETSYDQRLNQVRCYVDQLSRIKTIVREEPDRPLVVSDFEGVASTMWMTLRRQANKFIGNSEVIVCGFTFHPLNQATSVAYARAAGVHSGLKGVDIQRGQVVGEHKENFSGDRRIFFVPKDSQSQLLTEVQQQAGVTLCNTYTQVIPGHYTVERVQNMPGDKRHYVVFMMKGEVAYLDNGRGIVESPRDYMQRINKEAGRDDVPLVMWVGFDGAKPTILGKPRVHDGDSLVDILVTCSPYGKKVTPQVAKATACREAAAASGLSIADGVTKYVDRQGIEHNGSEEGRVEVVVYENKQLPRPVKMTAVWDPEVVRVQEIIASAKNKWTSVFGDLIHQWQRDRIKEGREWNRALEEEQIVYEGRIKGELEAEIYQALREFERVGEEHAFMMRPNRIDWLECCSFNPGGRELLYTLRRNLMGATKQNIKEAVAAFKNGPTTSEGFPPYVTRNPFNGDLTGLGVEMTAEGKISHPLDIKPPVVVSSEGELGIAASETKWGRRSTTSLALLEAHAKKLLQIRSPFLITDSLIDGLGRLDTTLVRQARDRIEASIIIETSQSFRQLCREALDDTAVRQTITNPLTLARIARLVETMNDHLIKFERRLEVVANNPNRLTIDEETQLSSAAIRMHRLMSRILELSLLRTNDEVSRCLKGILDDAKKMHKQFTTPASFP